MSSLIHVPKTIDLLLPLDAAASVRYAASELADHLLEAGGVAVSSKANPGTGFCIRLDTACGPEFARGLEEEGFRYRVRESGIDIAGRGPRGTLYGVYAFLEEQIGWCWFTSTVRRVPSWDRALMPVEVSQAPAFAYREVYWRDATNGELAPRLRLNGACANIDEAHGGRIRFHRFSHTFDELVPPGEFFDVHPEYFALVDGRRLGERTQLCLTNPDVLKICIDRVRAWIAENPDCSVFSIAQNDWYNCCACPDCSALDTAEGGHAGSMIHFVNAIADAIVEESPQVMLHTFAYLYTRDAPRTVRPRPNVIVRLCSIECCFAHPLEECAYATTVIDVQEGQSSSEFRGHDQSLFVRDLRAWSAICRNLYIWDYTVNFANYLQPFPNYQVFQANLRLFQRCGVRGVLEQGNFSPGAASAFAGLKTYLLAKLLWNPDCDVSALITQYLEGVFGAAAPYLREILDRMIASVEHFHMSIYDMPNAPYFTDAWLLEADALFEKAEAAAETPETHDRVALEHLSIRYVRLARLALDAPGRDAAWDDFERDLRRFGVSEVFERKELTASIQRLREERYGLNREGVPYVNYRM